MKPSSQKRHSLEGCRSVLMLPACPQNHFVYPNPSSRWCHPGFVSHQMSPSAKGPVAQKKHLTRHLRVRRPFVTCPCPCSPSTVLSSWLPHWCTEANAPLAGYLLLAEYQVGGRCLRKFHWCAWKRLAQAQGWALGLSVTTLSLQQTIAVVSHHRDSKLRSLVTLIVKWPTARHCHSPAVGWSLVSAALQTAGLGYQASETQLPSQRDTIVSRAEAAALYNCPESSGLSLV